MSDPKMTTFNDLTALKHKQTVGPIESAMRERVLTDVNGRKYITTEPFKPDYNTEAVLVEEMQRMAKRIEELEIEREQVQYKYGPMSFQIYLPVYSTSVVNNAKLPWVYDQDRSSGNVASMWVTPVARMGANGPRSKT